MSGSVVASDSKRIWEAAEFVHAHMYATKRRTPPSEADKRIVNQYSLAAHITANKPGSNAPLNDYSEHLTTTRPLCNTIYLNSSFSVFNERRINLGCKFPIRAPLDVVEAPGKNCIGACPLLPGKRLNL